MFLYKVTPMRKKCSKEAMKHLTLLKNWSNEAFKAYEKLNNLWHRFIC
jgi:hypothetical protein